MGGRRRMVLVYVLLALCVSSIVFVIFFLSR